MTDPVANPLVAPRKAAPAADPARHLRDLLDRQPAPLLRVGVDGRLLAANRAALKLLGTDDVALVRATRLPDRLAPGDRQAWDDFMARAARGGGPASILCEIEDLGGSRRAIELNGMTFDHHDGVPSLLVTARDATETARTEKALADSRVEIEALSHNIRQLERLARVGRLALDVTTELQDAAGNIDQHARSLLTGGSLGAKERAEVEALQTAAVGVSSLVRQLLQQSPRADSTTARDGE
jgi:PAS domain S-box-containing protein